MKFAVSSVGSHILCHLFTWTVTYIITAYSQYYTHTLTSTHSHHIHSHTCVHTHTHTHTHRTPTLTHRTPIVLSVQTLSMVLCPMIERSHGQNSPAFVATIICEMQYNPKMVRYSALYCVWVWVCVCVGVWV